MQQSLADSDCVVIMGSNMAENHPVGFRFVVKAKEKGATLIHVDPRFSRTSAMADVHAPIRAGSDVVFLGALVNYVLNSERWNTDAFFREYVGHYTNAPVLLREDFKDTEDLEGLFSGYIPDERRYAFDTWQYAHQDVSPAPGSSHAQDSQAEAQFLGRLTQPPELDPTMQDPRCVLQVVKRHFSRYTPEMVERMCGLPQPVFLRIAEELLRNAGPDRTTAWCYAVGWTQHTIGAQVIGCCALLQLLLGNIGRPGGGIMALRGHSTIQGSTDIPTLYNLLPGYLPMPTSTASENDDSLDAYLRRNRPSTGWWTNMPKYMVSLLKAYYGDTATENNGYAYDLLPKIGADYSFQPMLLMMKDGTMKGLFCMGQNPPVGGQHSGLGRRAMANLDWLVVRDAYEIEAASFWYDSPEVHRGEMRPRDIRTEVFLMPAAIAAEKDGSYTNTQRMLQWHDKAVDPPGDARSEAWFIYHLGKRLKELYANDTSPRGRQIRALTWDYSTVGPHADPELEAVVKEINGYRLSDGKPVPSFLDLKEDGSTVCGAWIYSGVMPEEGKNLGKNRKADDKASLEWGFAWPANRRILYNRASADPRGKPWSERKKWVWWDSDKNEWTGYDVPDFPRNKPPDYEPPPGAQGIDAHRGDEPFIMMADGRGQLFATAGMRDGPLPTHYEPWETVEATNLLYPEQLRSPVSKAYSRPDNPYHEIADPRFPYVFTTYRLTEHHTAGGMSRFLPWLSELQPEGFVEISPELARAIGVNNGDWVTVSTLRSQVETRALVTDRMKPLKISGRQVHQVGMPYHFGHAGIARGGIANDLGALTEDPNSLIQGKVFTCNLRRGRREPQTVNGRQLA